MFAPTGVVAGGLAQPAPPAPLSATQQELLDLFGKAPTAHVAVTAREVLLHRLMQLPDAELLPCIAALKLLALPIQRCHATLRTIVLLYARCSFGNKDNAAVQRQVKIVRAIAEELGYTNIKDFFESGNVPSSGWKATPQLKKLRKLFLKLDDIRRNHQHVMRHGTDAEKEKAEKEKQAADSEVYDIIIVMAESADRIGRSTGLTLEDVQEIKEEEKKQPASNKQRNAKSGAWLPGISLVKTVKQRGGEVALIIPGFDTRHKDANGESVS